MILDKKGKLFGKVSVIDLAVILIVLIAIGATVFKFGLSPHRDVVVSDASIEYTFKIKGLRDFSAKQFAVGDAVYDAEAKKAIGKIVDVSLEPATEYLHNADGTIAETEKPEKSDVYLTIQSDARITNEGYFANGTRQIAVGSSIDISTQKIECSGKVTQVRQK
ncbi:MAG: DUF4330 domain-containing protein [Ruminococcaceae bacterium]|nr:DUF4330 domain-containing protein [Oscillospiraceae bacterium]